MLNAEAVLGIPLGKRAVIFFVRSFPLYVPYFSIYLKQIGLCPITTTPLTMFVSF